MAKRLARSSGVRYRSSLSTSELPFDLVVSFRIHDGCFIVLQPDEIKTAKSNEAQRNAAAFLAFIRIVLFPQKFAIDRADSFTVLLKQVRDLLATSIVCVIDGHRTCDVAVHQSSQLPISTDAQRLKRLLDIASSFGRCMKHLLITQAERS